MIEKPDVPDEVIVRALEECYGIRPDGLDFIPRGLDAAAWAYRAEADGQAYFVKVSKGRADEAGAWAPMLLAEQGFAEVIAPVKTAGGAVLGFWGEFTLRVQPFVSGERAMDAGMTHALWMQCGDFLGRLHKLDLSAAVRNRIRRESFAARRLAWVQELQGTREWHVRDDAISAELQSFWQGQQARIAALIERTMELRQAVREASWPMVLCHGDIHSGNLLLGDDGRMYVIDWDDVLVAPRERDLMFVLAELPAPEEPDFFAAYGSRDVNRLALAYYRHDWCIEDIGAFGVEILDKYTGEETRLNALHWFKSLFAPGGSVPSALAESMVGAGL